MTVLRWFASQDLTELVVYLIDTTYYEDSSMSGFVAICEQFESASFYVATLYHEWYNPKT